MLSLNVDTYDQFCNFRFDRAQADTDKSGGIDKDEVCYQHKVNTRELRTSAWISVLRPNYLLVLDIPRFSFLTSV